MIRGAIFDVDGTILDSSSVWNTLCSRYVESLGKIPEPNLDGAVAAMSTRQAAEYLISHYDITKTVPQVMSETDAMIKGGYAEQVSLKAGVRECLNSLWERKIPMTVVTAGNRGNVEAAFQRLGILLYFQGIFICSEQNTDKTKPDIYLAAARSMGSIPEETLVFEDALHALETAKRAGFRTVAVEDVSNEGQRARLREIADYYTVMFERRAKNT